MQERGRGGGGAGGPSNNGGWPLGLQPLHVHIQMMNMMSRAPRSREQQHLYTYMNHHHHHHNPHQMRFLQGDVSPFFLSTYTPSISSLSSSDLDTESTGSFFPERSTTLGNLIGIHSRSQRNQTANAMDNVNTQLLQSKNMTKAQRLHACWCAFTLVMKCACYNSNVNPIQESLSPSLAHLLELERRAAHSQPPEEATLQCETFDEDNEFEGVEESSHYSRDIALFDGVGESSHYSRDIALFDGLGESSHHKPTTNTLFDDDGILPPHPSGAPLKAALREFTTSPTTAAYLSTDWSAGVPIVRKRKHYQSSHGRFHTSLCPSFWKHG